MSRGAAPVVEPSPRTGAADSADRAAIVEALAALLLEALDCDEREAEATLPMAPKT